MGLLPDSRCGHTPSLPAGCLGVFAMGEALLTAGFAALEPFVPADPKCGTLDTLVAMGPPAPTKDLLAVYLTSWGRTFATGNTPSRAAVMEPMKASWTIELWETRYPTGDGKRPPPAADLHAVNRHVYAHGELLYAGIAAAIRDGSMQTCQNCSIWQMSVMSPLGPLGGMSGWKFSVMGEPCVSNV